MTLRTVLGGFAVILLLTGCGPNGQFDDAAVTSPGSNLTSSINLAPVAYADSAAMMPGVSQKIAVLENDEDPDNDPISIILVETPVHGIATIDTNGTPDIFHDDTIRYTAHANYLGSETFSYTISDNSDGRASGVVSISIGVNLVTPGAPLALNDSALTSVDQLVTIPVLDNDMDSDGDSLVITSITASAYGSATINNGGTPADHSDDSINYQPTPGYVGPDSFLYTITDGTTAVTAAVSVDIMPTIAAGLLSAKVSGVVMKGPLIGAQISLFSINGNGNKSAVLPIAQTVTDASGYWDVHVPLPRENLLVVSRGGAYQDEAQSQGVVNKSYIKFKNSEALETVLPATDTHAVLSVYSNALLLKSRYYTAGGDFMSKHQQARSAAITAFGYDPLVAEAADPANPATYSNAEARRHALVLGGAASAINRISTSLGKTDPDHEMVYAIVRDLSDCQLDGKDFYGPITFTFGGVPTAIPTNIDLNNEILRFRNNNFDSYSSTPLATVDTTLCAASVVSSDTTAPVITLLGSDPMPVAFNTVFSDPGVSAIDNLDGDITGSVTTSGTVDTSVPGSYVLIYSVTDTAGNTSTISRTIVIAASSSPVITLLGASSIVLEAGTTYIDAGALAADPEDGDLSASIILTNPVDTLVPGTYAVTYNVTDSDGLFALTTTRSVVIVDTTAPALTLAGAAVVNVQQNDSYLDAGATALDIVNGNLSTSITIINPVDTSVTGSYTVVYQVADSAGNIATANRTVNVITTGTPSINLAGAATVNVEAGGSYTDAGATALDPEDGDISPAIVVVNLVDTTVTGTYVITYNVVDSDGNSGAEVVRTVIVADTTPPAITLVGSPFISLLAGATYVDNGATAMDSFDGDLSVDIVITNPVDTSTAGTYTILYNVSDSGGNAALQVTRTVAITSNNAPVISMLGNASITHEAATPYVDPGATATDVEDGDISAAIVGADSVDTTTVGSYTVTYNVTDSDGNAAVQLTRTVTVTDTSVPVIALSGANPQLIEVGSAYTEPGATATDNLDAATAITAAIVIDAAAVNTSALGTYTVTYDVTDTNGNAAVTVNRLVQVVDTTIPVIALTGANPHVIEAGSAYTEPGASATDNLDAPAAITAAIVIDATAVNASALGTYTVTYDVTDANGNAAVTVNRSVQVVDTTIPVITLIGTNPQLIEIGSAYTEPGATATDNLDAAAAITAAIVIDATAVNTSALGTYSVTYDVTDANGNAAVTVNRSVQVVDTTIPVIALTGANPHVIEAGSAYTELGASATDNLDAPAAITAAIVIDATAVNASALGTYTVTYDVTDANGNTAVTVNRSVQVVDTTIPVIALSGANPQVVEAGTAYIELGATANDNLDAGAAITAAIVIDAAGVNTSALGTYTVTYNVTDASGNVAVTFSRSVQVVDTTAPVITILGDNPESVAEDTVYADADATASDSFEGDVSAGIVTVNNVDTSLPGTYTVTYDVADGASNNAIQAIRNVTVTPVNDAPVLDFPVPDDSASEALVYSSDLSPYFSDEENDTLTFILTGLPAGTGLFINSGTGVLSGTPNINDFTASPISLTIKAEDPSLDSAQDSFLLTIIQSVDLSLLKTVDDATPNEGQAIVYTVSVSNAGPSEATNIDIQDLQPAGVTFGAVIPGTGSFAGNVWSLPSLASGTSATIIINATVDTGTAGSSITNVAELIAVDQTETDIAETASATVNVPTGAAILKTWVGGTSGPPGSETDWNRNNNWLPVGVPDTNDEIVIPNATFYPVLDADLTASSLRVVAGANLDIGSHTLTITGEVRGDSPITGTGLVVVTNGTVRGGLPSLRADGYVDVQNNLTVNGDLTVLGTLDADTSVVVNGNLYVTGGTGILLMQVGGSLVIVNGDVMFDGGDHSVFVGSKAPMDRGDMYVTGNFTQAGNAFAFVAENAHRVILDGTADQTITMMNPDNSNPGPDTPPATGSRFANLYVAKDQATDGAVVLATDVAVLIQLQSSGAYNPRFTSPTGRKIVAGGADFVLGTFDNVPIEFVDGDDFDDFGFATFENMAIDTVQIALRRTEGFISVYDFDNLSFTTVPNTAMGGYYIETENLGSAPITLNIWTSFPISGASESNTIGNFTLNW